MRKLIPAIALSLALLTAVPTTVFAHGHSGGTLKRTEGLCAVENRNIARNHRHDGVLCAGHCLGDGHDDHSSLGHHR